MAPAPDPAPGQLVAVAVSGANEFSVAWTGCWRSVDLAELQRLEVHCAPRWVTWSPADLLALTRAGLRVARCWDLATVHRLLFGGWSSDPGRVWAAVTGLSENSLPVTGQLDLLGPAGEPDGDLEELVQPDGHLRPEWFPTGWQRTPGRRRRWVELALTAADRQRDRLAALPDPRRALATAQAESGAEQVCAELTVAGLPIDRAQAERLIESSIGPRPADAAEASQLRQRRDQQVLRHAPAGEWDLRSPASVRAMLDRLGYAVPDTRSWRLEQYRDHPAVAALLAWRKAERIATTYGYEWLDRHVGPDDRLRGNWTGSDGAAGRMTASAGLHNLPAELRAAVAAPPGQRLVRADLGQIEPRVLAAVSGDAGLAAASAADDLYAPVAEQLRVARAEAKIAVLAAMYGQTSGTAGAALRGLDRSYPVAMRYLRAAYDAGRAGTAVRTYGGRLVRMWPIPTGRDAEANRAAAAARGRFARNAVIQGAAAELFKVWAVTVRARSRALGAQIVLCLHDELLVLVPAETADQLAELVAGCLTEAASRWAPRGSGVRFVADISVLQRWSQAKA